jgi:hypothetical protein
MEMAKQNVEAVATQQHMVASWMPLIHLGNPHVGAAINGPDDLTRAGCQDRCAEDRVTRWIGGHDTAGTQTPAVDCNEINAVAGAAIVRVQR